MTVAPIASTAPAVVLKPLSPLSHRAAENRTVHNSADVVVIGAGIFGSAIAVALGDQGRSVILVEKSMKQPDRIVGELLQPGGVQALERLGLRDCLEGIDAIKVHGYDVIYYGEEVRISYPDETITHARSASTFDESQEKKSSKRKRPEGRSFHHGRFVSKLRARALANPNVTVIEATATELVRCEYTGQILGVETSRQGQPGSVFGSLTIVADGYASKFRKEFRNDAPISKSKFWALELIDADLPMPNHGHVLLGDGTPVLLYQIGTHETRALIDIPDNLPSAAPEVGGVKGYLRNVVLPTLPKQVRPSFSAAIERDRLRSMPNSWLPPITNKVPGLVILGDAMNMRHPLTGGGMTVALNDAVLLSDLLSPQKVPDLEDTKLVIQQMRTFHWKRKDLTAVINILAQALYSLFAADDPQLKALQLGCFRYFKLGGNCVDGPVGLLAGIIRQPFVLFYHFFSVALLAIWIHITSSGMFLVPLKTISSIGVFWKACVVLFPYIFAELRP